MASRPATILAAVSVLIAIFPSASCTEAPSVVTSGPPELVIEPPSNATASVIFLHGFGQTVENFTKTFSPIFTLLQSTNFSHVRAIIPFGALNASDQEYFQSPSVPTALAITEGQSWFTMGANTSVPTCQLESGAPCLEFFTYPSCPRCVPGGKADISVAAARITALIAAEIASGIAPDRVLLMGLSQGAVLASKVFAESSVAFGGVLAFVGWLPDGREFVVPDDRAAESGGIRYVLAENDEAVRPFWSKEGVEVLENAGIDVQTRIIEGATHNLPLEVYSKEITGYMEENVPAEYQYYAVAKTSGPATIVLDSPTTATASVIFLHGFGLTVENATEVLVPTLTLLQSNNYSHVRMFIPFGALNASDAEIFQDPSGPVIMTPQEGQSWFTYGANSSVPTCQLESGAPCLEFTSFPSCPRCVPGGKADIANAASRISALITAEIGHGISPDRVLLIGVSQGAALASKILAESSVPFGGALAFIGWLPDGRGFVVPEGRATESGGIRYILAENDEFVRPFWSMEGVEVLENAGIDVQTRIIEGATHNLPLEVYSEEIIGYLDAKVPAKSEEKAAESTKSEMKPKDA